MLFAPNAARAVVIPDVSMLHHEHLSAKSDSAPSRVPFWVVTVSLAPVTFDEYVRRSSGRAEDTPPAWPGAGSDQGVVVTSWGCGSGTWAGPAGGLSPLDTQSQPLLTMFSRSCRSAHSLARLLRSRSAWAASFSFCTSATRSSNADAMFVQSVEAVFAFVSNTSA
ncbi:hypothetical protein PRAC110570_08515 [Propionibacterium acidifaciens]